MNPETTRQPHNISALQKRILPYPNQFNEDLVTTREIKNTAEVCSFLAGLEPGARLAVDLETTGLDPHTTRPTIIAFSIDGREVWQLSHEEMQEPETRAAFNQVMNDPGITKIFHNAKFDIKFLQKHYGSEFQAAECTYVMRRLLICGLTLDSDLGACSLEYLNYRMSKAIRQEFIGNTTITPAMRQYASIDVAATWHLWPILHEYLKIENLTTLYNRIERPLIPIVAKMELVGVGLDLEYLAELERVLVPAIENQEKEFQGRLRSLGIVGKVHRELKRKELEPVNSKGQLITHVIEWETLNINSSQQMQKMLAALGFVCDKADAKTLEAPIYSGESMQTARERLNLPVDNEFMIAAGLDIIDRVLMLRGLKKTLGTYVQALQRNPGPEGSKEKGYLNPETGRVHPNFGQVSTDTGRFACAAPNAQNQTTDEKMGKVTATPAASIEQINGAEHLTAKVRAALLAEFANKGKVMIPGPWSLRKGYKPKDGHGFITIDYAACELRILAEMTMDPGLIANMNQEEVDPHTFNAAIMYNCSHGEVTKGQRSAAKNGIYGKVYGIGKQKLAATLKTTPENAGKVLATFSAALPVMEKKLKARAEMALQYGYSTSMAGRKRYYSQPRNSFERAMIGRQGVNMPIQATNADITKLAMVLVDEAITPFNAVIVLSIHDELVIECPLECIEEVTEIVKEKMLEAEANFLSVVKCKVDGGWSRYWGH
jgi:DNA polymerase-1